MSTKRMSVEMRQMFSRLGYSWLLVTRFNDWSSQPSRTATALVRRGVAEVREVEGVKWIRLSKDWMRLESLERSLANVWDTNLEKTKKNQELAEELERLYEKFRDVC